MTAQPRQLTDDQWQRMSWHARQQWLRAANAYRSTLVADIARLVDERRDLAAGVKRLERAAPAVERPSRAAAIESSKRRAATVTTKRNHAARGALTLHSVPSRPADTRTAQQILDELGPDPEAAAHWLVLCDVVETTCPARHCVARVEAGGYCPTHTTARSQRAA